jgi:hypothetical protein
MSAEYKSRWWKRNLQFRYTNKDFLYREYVVKKKPCTQIAKEQGTTYKTILRWLGIHKIPKYPHWEYYRVNLVGRKFGHLQVIKEFTGKLENDKLESGIKWECRCDCGKKLIVRGRLLLHGDRTNCGCITTSFKGYAEISGTYFNRVKLAAKKRDLEFNITLPQIWNLFLKQQRRCALSNVELFTDANSLNKEATASIDRIDSDKGYTSNNIQWVHKDLNRCKWDFSEEEFLGWVKKIYDYRIHPQISIQQ